MYASLNDLEKRLGAGTLLLLTDDDGDGVADAAIVNAALSQASARMNAALAHRYATPVSPATDELAWICCSLAAPLLYARRRDAVPDVTEEQRRAAAEFLEALRKGRASLPGVAPRNLPESVTRGKKKHFSEERLAEF